MLIGNEYFRYLNQISNIDFINLLYLQWPINNNSVSSFSLGDRHIICVRTGCLV
jgi:hypothetical protein